MNLVLDSASNRHNTLVESYAQLLKRDENVLHPRCQGAAERGRCMDHVMNLVAKVRKNHSLLFSLSNETDSSHR